MNLNKNKFISKMIKFSLHHKAFYCYLGMSVWIFFLVTAMYRYMAFDAESTPLKKGESKTVEVSKTDLRYREISMEVCNPPETIVRGSEGLIDKETYLLQGVLTVLRHGDRGPLTHLQHGDRVPCDKIPHSHKIIFKSYEDFVANGSASGRAWWVSGPGPFHNFPSLPANTETTHCALGQLTPTGLLQMIEIGNIFKEAYYKKLGLDRAELNTKKSAADYVTYSTRYRRTFTSVAGFWWGFVGQNAGHRLATVKEAHSVMFCFKDCACPAINKLSGRISAKGKKRLDARPAIKELFSRMAKVLLLSQEHVDPTIIRDAILAYMCHGASLPCIVKKHDGYKPKMKILKTDHERPSRSLLQADIDTLNMELDYINNQGNEARKAREVIEKEDYKQKPLDFDAQMEREKLQYYQLKYLEDSDGYDDVVLIKRNIDADFNFLNELKIEDDFEDYKEATVASPVVAEYCIKKEHVLSLYEYLNFAYKQQIKNYYTKQRAVLMAYGLIKNIVQSMIKMISENKPKFVLYSGHDKTMHALCLALGLYKYEHFNIRYASRMVFEVYRKKDLLDEFKFTRRKPVAQDYYFRVIFNGDDVTNKLLFCQDKMVVFMEVADVASDNSHSTYLCPLENIVRFVHDDYFSVLNVSNYKDACAKYGSV